MTFQDIFKSSFLENVTSFSALDMVIALALAFVLGLFIFLVYKKTFNGVMYSAGFGVSLLGMTLITTLIILAVTSNIVLSLGMVGALSIVRFRTAIKDPVDTVFMFWSITCGIMTGAGQYLVGAFACFGVGLLYFVISLFHKKLQSPYLLVLRYEPDKTANIAKALKTLPRHRVKSRTMTRDGAELTLEISLKDSEMATIDQFLQVDGVLDASLVSYEGEFGL